MPHVAELSDAAAKLPMTELLPSMPMFLAFVGASLVLAITPGPGVLYVVTRSLIEGRAAGLASVLGVALGNLGNAVSASLGLVTVFSVSSLAFEIVRYAGVLYLFFLAWRVLRRPGLEMPSHVDASDCRNRRVVWDGFVVALFNPKTALFFAAFLPQFMVMNADSALQPFLFAMTFVAIAAATDSVYVLSASVVARRLPHLRSGRFLAASTYFGIGLLAALSTTEVFRQEP